MSAFANYAEAVICNRLRGTAMLSAPSTLHIATFNGNPTDASPDGTEIINTIRAAGRVTGAFGAPNDGVIKNSAVVDFGAAVALATVSHFALFDAAKAGNLMVYSALTKGAQSVSANTNV